VIVGARGLDHIRKGYEQNKLNLTEKELEWIGTLQAEIDRLPKDPGEIGKEVLEESYKFDPKKYDM
jgi:hypothetical protein